MPELITIITPVYNERENLQRFHTALCEVLWREAYDFEIIIVDDGSSDDSTRLVRGMAKRDPRLRLLALSRNFGKEIALTAGLHAARGRAAILIDADLQHPVELIPEMLRRWEKGARMVVGVRQSNSGEGMIKSLGSRLYYRLISLLSEAEVVPRSTDYRLIDREAIDAFKRFRERNRMTRSLLDWLGFTPEYVSFRANARAAGKAGYGTMKLFRLAFTSFVSHSLFPLRIAGYLGVAITLVSGSLGLVIFATKYLSSNQFGFTGAAVLATINVFLTGVTLMCLGLIALYVANIHEQTLGRPLYVVREDMRATGDKGGAMSPAHRAASAERPSLEGESRVGGERSDPPHPGTVARRSASKRSLTFIRHFPPAAYA